MNTTYQSPTGEQLTKAQWDAYIVWEEARISADKQHDCDNCNGCEKCEG